jgi:hypothetical protein
VGDLIAQLDGLLGASRPAPEPGPLGAPRVWRTASGIEVAALEVAAAPAPRLLTDAWRRQRRNRPTPVLLLVQSPRGIDAIGPEGVRPDPAQISPQLVEELASLRDGRNLEEAVQRLQALLAEHALGVDTSTAVRPACPRSRNPPQC